MRFGEKPEREKAARQIIQCGGSPRHVQELAGDASVATVSATSVAMLFRIANIASHCARYSPR
jgi:hypothetical protein